MYDIRPHFHTTCLNYKLGDRRELSGVVGSAFGVVVRRFPLLLSISLMVDYAQEKRIAQVIRRMQKEIEK